MEPKVNKMSKSKKKQDPFQKRSAYCPGQKFNAEYYLMKATLDCMLSLLRLLRNYIIKHFGTKSLNFSLLKHNPAQEKDCIS